jgi:flavorubredoxin
MNKFKGQRRKIASRSASTAQPGRQTEIKQAIAAMKELRKQAKDATVAEILGWRDEGRK